MDVTPPRPDSELANLSPRSYLEDIRLLPALKRRATINLSAQAQKKLRFDPPSTKDDTTILNYHNRITSILPSDREKLVICYPFTNALEELKFELKDLRTETQKLRHHVSTLEERDLELRHHVSILEKRNLQDDKRRLAMFSANLLVQFVDKLCEKKGVKLAEGAGNDVTHAKTRYERAADYFPKDKFQKDFGLPSKYHKALQSLPKYLQLRNRAAHETEKEFAQLLMTEEYRNKHEYFYWGPLLFFCYGKTVEELAAEEENGIMIDQTSDDDDALD